MTQPHREAYTALVLDTLLFAHEIFPPPGVRQWLDHSNNGEQTPRQLIVYGDVLKVRAQLEALADGAFV